MKAIVIQSHNPEALPEWVTACMATVRQWARGNDFSYRFLGEEFFCPLPAWVIAKTENRRVVATDLARLFALRESLEAYDIAVWCDADFLVFNRNDLQLGLPQQRGFGREVWVEHDSKGRLRARPKIHNAFMYFRRGDAFLDFYIEAATRMLERVDGDMVPQFIGPKFLTALHNLVGFHEVKTAAMFSPLVLHDILEGAGPALEILKAEQGAAIAGANLSASYVGTEGISALTINEMTTVTEKLLSQGDSLFSV